MCNCDNFISLFCAHWGGYSFLWLGNTNAKWGLVAVTVFFMLSGCLLYYNHDEVHKDEVKEFYKKRWKQIFPSFYLAYVFVLLIQIFRHGNEQFAGKRPWTFIFTLTGMDGYLTAAIPNYYILGEWFLGAIIILYIIYPLLCKLVNLAPIIFAVIASALFLVTFNFEMLNQESFRNIFACIFSFAVGIYVMKYRLYRSKAFNWFCLASFITIAFLPININENILNHVEGILLFFGLFAIGSIIMNGGICSRIIAFISGISYEIFLLQHAAVSMTIKVISPSQYWKETILVILIIIMTIISAWILMNIRKILVEKIGKGLARHSK